MIMSIKPKIKLIDRIMFCDHRYPLIIALIFFGLSYPIKDTSTFTSVVLFAIGFTILCAVWFPNWTSPSKVINPRK
jgi:hypothetical protein